MGASTNHWVNQALIAIPEVCRQPPRGLVDGPVWPFPIREVNWLELLVFCRRVLEPMNKLTHVLVMLNRNR